MPCQADSCDSLYFYLFLGSELSLRVSLIYGVGQVIAGEDVFVGVLAVNGLIQADFFRHFADFHGREHVDDPEHGVGEDECPD